MRLRSLVPALAIAVLATSAASADTMMSSSGNPFAKDYFNGKWSCKTTSSANKSMVGKTATITFEAVGGHWQKISYPDGQTWVTWDPKLKKYVGETIGNDGSWGVGQTTGWVGNVFAVKDILNGGGAPLGVFAITKKSATMYTDSYTVGGKVLGADTCTKAAM